MKLKTKLLSIIASYFLLSLFVWASFASDRDLKWIDLITRKERGANESRRYAEQPAYQAMLQARAAWNKKLETMKKKDRDAYLAEEEKSYHKEVANKYLMQNYGSDYSIDHQNKYYEWHKLRQTESFKKGKTKIIIHHTADIANFADKSDVLKYMQKTYKFHAFTRWWWDIGYNFLIDPFGNIYEGRAGWPDIIGTHTAWNNSPSLGIALMGNFEIQKPTAAQLKSLVKILVSLTQKYNIDPMSKTTYHRKSVNAPYLETLVNYTIAGHKDAGYTACPWKNLYRLLPAIRKQVKKRLVKYALANTVISTPSSSELMLPWFTYSADDVVNIHINLGIDTIASCESLQSEIILSKCELVNGQVSMTFKKNWKASWKKSFLIKDNNSNEHKITILFLRQNDLAGFLKTMKNKYIKKHPLSQTIPSTKIWHQITLNEAKQYLQQKIRVLLYDLSQNLDTWEISCPNTCSFVLDKNVQVAKSWVIKVIGDTLELSIQWQKFIWANLYISSEDNLITVNNYTRTSYAGIPRNVFKWTLLFTKDNIYNKKNHNFDYRYIIVNTLDFDEYLKWIVETNDTENIEKNKVMAMIAKSYALFYMHPDNKHPDIPQNAQYNAIDDPDLFQKYVWAGLEKTITKRYQALEQTNNEIILYNWYVPLLPYFNCSAGFTFSAKDKRWRTDTPYLQSRLDFAKCDTFNGHGVWMSWKGAQRRAERWWDWKKILDYYYSGIKIVNL